MFGHEGTSTPLLAELRYPGLVRGGFEDCCALAAAICALGSQVTVSAEEGRLHDVARTSHQRAA